MDVTLMERAQVDTDKGIINEVEKRFYRSFAGVFSLYVDLP